MEAVNVVLNKLHQIDVNLVAINADKARTKYNQILQLFNDTKQKDEKAKKMLSELSADFAAVTKECDSLIKELEKGMGELDKAITAVMDYPDVAKPLQAQMQILYDTEMEVFEIKKFTSKWKYV